MPVMHVGVVGVAVHPWLVDVSMGVRFAIVPRIVRMLMMLIVNVRVTMLEIFVDVFVSMPFAHVQPDAQNH